MRAILAAEHATANRTRALDVAKKKAEEEAAKETAEQAAAACQSRARDSNQ